MRFARKALCRAVMPTAGLLLVECVVPTDNSRTLAKDFDMTMMVFPGGAERTEAEFRFLGSTVRREDAAGTVVEEWEGQIDELAPVKTTLEAGKSAGAAVGGAPTTVGLAATGRTPAHHVRTTDSAKTTGPARRA